MGNSPEHYVHGSCDNTMSLYIHVGRCVFYQTMYTMF